MKSADDPRGRSGKLPHHGGSEGTNPDLCRDDRGRRPRPPGELLVDLPGEGCVAVDHQTSPIEVLGDLLHPESSAVPRCGGW